MPKPDSNAFSRPMTAARCASSRQSATRLATGPPSGRVWVTEREVDSPIAPARSASSTIPAIASRSSPVASSSSARAPIAYMRSAEWPI